MGVSIEGRIPQDDDWTFEDAERLLNSLTGVISARMVGRPGQKIDEIHVLTTREVSAKQTVRNVESALLAQLDLEVDHRKISVARTDRSAQDVEAEDGEDDVSRFLDEGSVAPETPRLLFVGHELESDGAHRVRARVTIDWNGERVVGKASGTDLPRVRRELIANALLDAVETLLDSSGRADVRQRVALSLDGVKVIDAFDRRYVLVGVHALHGRDVAVLSGSAPADDGVEPGVIMAALQATDRWVRGRL